MPRATPPSPNPPPSRPAGLGRPAITLCQGLLLLALAAPAGAESLPLGVLRLSDHSVALPAAQGSTLLEAPAHTRLIHASGRWFVLRGSTLSELPRPPPRPPVRPPEEALSVWAVLEQGPHRTLHLHLRAREPLELLRLRVAGVLRVEGVRRLRPADGPLPLSLSVPPGVPLEIDYTFNGQPHTFRLPL